MTDSTQQQQNGTTSSDIPSSGMTLNIRMSTSTRFTIPREADSKVITPTSTTILEVKQLIAAHPSSDNCPVERQRLIFRGRILSDHDKTLEQCGVTEDHAVLHLVKGSAIPLPGGTPGGAPAAAPVGTTPATTGGAPAATPGGGMDFGAMMRQMQQMQGAGAGAGAGDPASMMQQMQNDPMMQQMMQNPEMMQSILNSPLFSNPDTLLAILNSNPQMRELMDSNPQLRHILSDPAVLQQTMQAMRDPQQMQTMMRNQDLAMSQIENYPGGFSALRRMYEEVQEPMMEAMSGSGASGGGADGASGSGDGSGGANASTEEGGAMPNPWGTPSTTTGSANRNAPNAPSRQQPAAPGANPWASLGSSTGGGAAGTGAGASPGTFPPPAFPGMPPMSMEQTLAMLENPQMQQMMQQITSNPEMMRFMMESNPAMRQMRESNPMAAQLMENPDFMRSMMDPNTIRMMMQLQRIQQGGAAGGVPNLGAGGTTGGTTGTGVPPVAPGQLDFSSLLNPQMSSMSVSSPGGGAGAAFAPPQQQQPPAERYQTQVTRLVEMGFSDREANLRALVATNGNINRAVERLLSGE